MANYSGGANWERQVLRYLGRKGFTVLRSAGSHSPVDLIAWNADGGIVVQCKKQRGKNKSYAVAKAELEALVVPFGWLKEVWVKDALSDVVFVYRCTGLERWESRVIGKREFV